MRPESLPRNKRLDMHKTSALRALANSAIASTLALTLSAAHADSQQQPLSIPQIVSSARGSLVLIKAYDNSGLIQQGSGFRIWGGRIATNAHVVANATRIEVFSDGNQLLGTAQYAEAISTSVDIAILPRLGPYGAVSPLASSVPAVGERIIVLGAPEGLTNTVSDGIVSAIRTLDGQSLLQITAPISPGSSGGPVLNLKGEVIGVSVSTYREGQNLNFAVPVSDLFAVASSPPGTVAFPREKATSRRISDGGDAVEDDRSDSRLAGSLRVGIPVVGVLGAKSYQLKDGQLLDIYTFDGHAGQTISLSVKSDDFDAIVSMVRFIGDSLDVIDTDDDGGGDSNALINTILPASTKYLVSVGAHDQSLQKRGRYVIDLREGTRPRASSRSGSSSLAEGDRWAIVATTDTRTSEIDKTSIRSMGAGIVRFWIRVTLASPVTNSEGTSYDGTMSQEEADCNRRSIRLGELHQYLEGRIVWSSRNDVMGSWRGAIPGSVGESILDFACAAARSNQRR